jgi:exopolysaccharide biosynthesis polyprenyl glycosylphosphotransferase
MIPRRFYWIADLLILILAFLLADVSAPHFHKLMASQGILQSALQSIFSPVSEYYRAPTGENLWILVVTSFPIIIFLDLIAAGKWTLQSFTRNVLAGPAAAMLGVSLVSLVLFSLRNLPIAIGRSLLFTFGLLSAVGLSSYRVVLQGYYRKQNAAGYYVRNIVLVGMPAATMWMKRYIEDHIRSSEYKVIGTLNAGISNPTSSCIQEKSGSQSSCGDANVLGQACQLGQLLIRNPIHEVIAIQPANGGEWMSQVIHDCDNMGILLRIVPESLVMGKTHRLRTVFPPQPLNVPAVVLKPPHLDSDALFIKRLIDVAISAFLLILLSPLLLLIAVAIKLTTPGLPIFYQWRVVGKNGVEFVGYKFTTMNADADQKKHELMQHNEMTGPVFKIKDDPRITRFGFVLRKYSLNELPQLWSVLKGDMSLVGPRPAFRHELERYEFWHKRKLSIRPGITCLWQIRGRNKINRFDDWVNMDLEYIDNWSLWLDFKIMIRTVYVVMSGTGT